MSRMRTYALLAGLLYYCTHITSVAAVVAFGSSLTDLGWLSGSGSDTAVRVGILLEVLLALGCVGNGVVLFTALRCYGPALAGGFAALRILEGAVIVAGTLPLLAIVSMRGATGTATSSFGESLVGIHDGAFLAGQGLVISVNTLVIAELLRRSQVVPRGIALLGLVGGALVLLSNLAQLFGVIEQSGGVAMVCAVPVFAFEIWFATYLVFRGFRSAAEQQSETMVTV